MKVSAFFVSIFSSGGAKSPSAGNIDRINSVLKIRAFVFCYLAGDRIRNNYYKSYFVRNYAKMVRRGLKQSFLLK